MIKSVAMFLAAVTLVFLVTFTIPFSAKDIGTNPIKEAIKFSTAKVGSIEVSLNLMLAVFVTIQGFLITLAALSFLKQTTWMILARSKAPLTILDAGGCGHVSLADSNKTIPIEGHGTIELNISGLVKTIPEALYVRSITGLLEGTDDNISFGTEIIFYTSKANGFRYMIGKRCGDLYYLHTSNASLKSNYALTSSGPVSTAPLPLEEEVDIDMERPSLII
ncbi:hypothetical protein HDU80_001447, partial [Chytriomyces hyalinus]